MTQFLSLMKVFWLLTLLTFLSCAVVGSDVESGFLVLSVMRVEEERRYTQALKKAVSILKSKEKKSKDEVADYISFRSSCEDQLAHQWKSKIYWTRNAAAGPFEAENNIAAKLRLTNKAFQFHLNSFIGLTLIAAFAFLVLMPLGRHLSGCCFAKWLTDFSTGLTYGILAAILLILLPILKKLNKKINDLISEIF